MSSPVCAVIPALDCSSTIDEVVTKTRIHLLDVFVVDDGSNDDSAKLASDAGAIVIRHPVIRGKGAALWTGLKRAAQEGFEHVVTLDGDGQHDPYDIPSFLDAKDRFPEALILGGRDITSSNVPMTSRLGNCIANFFLSLSARQRLPDTQCGFRLYPVNLIVRLPLKGRGFEFESEVIIRAARVRIPIQAIAISTHYPQARERVTHFNLCSDTWRIFVCILESFFWK